MTGRTRWWLAAGVGLGLILVAPGWRVERLTRSMTGAGVPCAIRGTALAQDGAGSGLDIDVTNVFGGDMAVVDLKSLMVIANVRVDSEPNGVSFSPLAPTKPSSRVIHLPLMAGMEMG